MCIERKKYCLSFAFLSFDRSLNLFDDVADHFSPRYFPSRHTQHRCSLFAAFYSFARFFVLQFLFASCRWPSAGTHTQRIFEIVSISTKTRNKTTKNVSTMCEWWTSKIICNYFCLWTFWFMFIYFCVGNFFVSRTHKNYDYVLRFWHLTSLNFEQREKHNYDDNTCTHTLIYKREKYNFFHIVSIEMRCRSLSLSRTLCVCQFLCRRELESGTHRSVCVCMCLCYRFSWTLT